MRTSRKFSTIAVGLILLTASIVQAGTVQFADIVYESQENRKHPESDERVIIVREDTGGSVDVCIGYINNNFEFPNAGVVSAAIEISRGEEAEIETVEIIGPVFKNSFGGCAKTARLQPGDSITFPFVFDGFERMKKDHIAVVAGALAVDGGDPGQRSACGGGSAAGLAEAGNGTAYLADIVFQAAERQKHPTKVERTIVVREDLTEPVKLCAGYLNAFSLDEGRINTKVLVSRQETAADGTVTKAIEKVKIAGKVREGSVSKCKEIDPLAAGDSVTFPFKLKGFPRMPSGSLATVLAGLVVDSADAFRNITCTDTGGGGGGTGGGGGGTGGGGGGTGGGGGSAGNNQQAAQLLRGCATSSIGVQFQWDKGQLHADRRVGSTVSTIGPFSSFAAAANAAAATWGCSGGAPTSTDDGSQMPRLSSWGSVSGRRLALRFEGTGGSRVHVDAWSSSTGAIHGAAQGSVAAAIRNFCARSDISC